MKVYTGVGSRQTPEEILTYMHEVAKLLARRGWVLRSGHAVGADRAFEDGSDETNGTKEIFLAGDAPKRAYEIAKRVHPAWHRCSQIARLFHARNVCQVLGLDLSTPSKFLICWTPNGEDVGGTRTAIALAREVPIPIYNLAKDFFPWKQWLNWEET